MTTNKRDVVKHVFSLFLTVLFLSAVAAANATERISMSFADGEAVIELHDNPAARSLLDHLPLTLTFEDYNSTEKISYPPHKLSTEGMPERYTPSAGDLTVYAPWGNLALFYQNFRSSAGLVPLGRVVSGMEFITRQKTAFTVRLKAVQ